MHLRAIKMFIYITRRAPTCFGTVVPSSGNSKFLAKITHNYGIQDVELKLIKIDKTDNMSTLNRHNNNITTVAYTATTDKLTVFILLF
jgi:hypothetical protein